MSEPWEHLLYLAAEIGIGLAVALVAVYILKAVVDMFKNRR